VKVECRNCAYAVWNLTPTGRISKTHGGRCHAPLQDLTKLVPACERPVRFNRKGIFPEEGRGCPVFTPRKKAQESPK
jgi:hypothetical protein